MLEHSRQDVFGLSKVFDVSQLWMRGRFCCTSCFLSLPRTGEVSRMPDKGRGAQNCAAGCCFLALGSRPAKPSGLKILVTRASLMLPLAWHPGKMEYCFLKQWPLRRPSSWCASGIGPLFVPTGAKHAESSRNLTNRIFRHFQMCLDEPRCAAWEVCTPLSPEAGSSQFSSQSLIQLESLGLPWPGWLWRMLLDWSRFHASNQYNRLACPSLGKEKHRSAFLQDHLCIHCARLPLSEDPDSTNSAADFAKEGACMLGCFSANWPVCKLMPTWLGSPSPPKLSAGC